jgi:release factor glutamine methyltransferase
MNQNDLRYLLKEKYNYTETQLIDVENSLKDFLSKDLSENLKDDLQKLEEGVPVAFLIGYVDFLNTRINLTHRTLIPRAETEYWTSIYIEKLKDKDNLNILDIFCGSGCIGIALAKNLENINITLTDISEEAIKQTKENLKINNIEINRFRVFESNIFESLGKEKFDYIFANPPYVENIYKTMGDSGLAFEPSVSLFGGEDGLRVVEKFIVQLKGHLTENGMCVMEFGHNQEQGIIEILKQNEFKDFEFFKDQFGIVRWVEIRN